MTAAKRELTRADIMTMEAYAAIRKERRARLSETRKRRRVQVGRWATFSFESYETMWMQVHEMLYIEKGGEAQIADELAAYGPMVPKGCELVVTLMFEIDDPVHRQRLLSGLGGVEHTVSLAFAGETVQAVPEGDVARSTESGRASSIHFLRFPFSDDQVAKFRDDGVQVVLGIGHEGYAHMAVIPESVRRDLCEDFD